MEAEDEVDDERAGEVNREEVSIARRCPTTIVSYRITFVIVSGYFFFRLVLVTAPGSITGRRIDFFFY